MSHDGRRFDAGWAGVLGPIYDRVIANVDVYLAGVDELVIEGVTVTVREAAGIAGWVGIVDADLSEFKEFKLELRLPNETAECGILFVVAVEVMDRTLIRGSGRTPGHGPKVRSKPRLASVPHRLRITPGVADPVAADTEVQDCRLGPGPVIWPTAALMPAASWKPGAWPTRLNVDLRHNAVNLTQPAIHPLPNRPVGEVRMADPGDRLESQVLWVSGR